MAVRVLKSQYSTISVSHEMLKSWKAFCAKRGFPMTDATEKALNRWMADGCDKDIEEFKHNGSPKSPRTHDLAADCARQAAKAEKMPVEPTVVEPEIDLAQLPEEPTVDDILDL